MKNIKRLTRIDYDEIFKLSQFSFQYTLTSKQLERKTEEADLHDIWGYVIDGKLAGKLHTIPLSIYINGKTFKMGGVNSVATWPEYRRQGIAKKLLYHSLQEMIKKGQTISFLHPFHVGFYRKYGWELAFTNLNYTIPIEKLQRSWNGKGYISRRKESSAFLHSIYTTNAKKYNGMLTRDENWWRLRVLTDEKEQVAIAYNEKDKAEGYIIYKVRNDVLQVREMIYTSINSMKLLYQFIANHDSMVKSVKITVPENDVLRYIIEDPMFEQEVEPYFMARIVDAFNFLKKFPFTPVNGEVNIHVTDDFLRENETTYNIRMRNGQATVTKNNIREEEGITCSIQQLTSIFLGYKRPTELYDYGLIEGEKSSIEQLEKMIPKLQTFLSDFY